MFAIKKAVKIEVRQLTSTNLLEIVDWILNSGRYCTYDKELNKIGIMTPEGTMYLTEGNWAAKGYSNSLGYHFWPIEHGYFLENYDIKDEYE